MRGRLTVGGLTPGISVSMAEEFVGKIELAPRQPGSDPSLIVRYPLSKHSITLLSEVSLGESLIDVVRGPTLEQDGEVILELGDTCNAVEDVLGQPQQVVGSARQFWAYADLGDNMLSLSLMFDGGRLTNIQAGPNGPE